MNAEEAMAVMKEFQREFFGVLNERLGGHYIVMIALYDVRGALGDRARFEQPLETEEDYAAAQRRADEYLAARTDDYLDQLCIVVGLKQAIPEGEEFPENYRGLPVITYVYSEQRYNEMARGLGGVAEGSAGQG